MKAFVIRYAVLIGLLLTVVWWARTDALNARAAVFLVFATFVGTDIISSRSKQKSNQHDHSLYDKFLKTIPSNGSIAFIKENNFAGFSFNTNKLIDIDRFFYEWNDAEHEFLDKKLEEKRKALYHEISEFQELIGVNTFPTKSSGWNTVPPEWEEDNPEHFHHIVSIIHNSASKIVLLHQDLIRECKKRLGDVQALES